jgi:hypothetical protein
MRRQLLATAAAVTTTLALAVAVPAIAQDEPELFTGPGNVHCEDLDLEGLTNVFDELTGNVDNEFFTATVSADGTSVTVVPKEGTVILAVIVKGGDDSFIYRVDFTDMVAPPVGQDNTPEISHYEVCIGEEEEETTTTPPPPPNGNGETTTTPAKVPTEVPAGVNGDSGSAGLVGLMIAASAAAAGFVLFARRRALHDS